jgi:alkylphosphonate utilization operon protein PhnA
LTDPAGSNDVNGNVLNSGDTVTVIKDLKVRDSSIPLKQGTVFRNIRMFPIPASVRAA